jgi:hypothetical protein
MDDPVQLHGSEPGPERPFTRSGEDQHCAEAEDVTGRSNITAHDLLW